MEKSQPSHCGVPDWGLMGHQGQVHVQDSQERNGHCTSHVQVQPDFTTLFQFPQMPTAELPMQGGDRNGVLPMAPPLQPKKGSCDTLESIVHEATLRKINLAKPKDNRTPRNCMEHTRTAKSLRPKQSQEASRRRRSEFEPGRWMKKSCPLNRDKLTICASCSAMFNMRDDDSNTITMTKFTEENSASQDESENRDEEGEGKGEMGRSECSRQSKAAAVATHNLSERRRRDRINQKMEALQKLVPNSSKTDKASMLDEVIAYLKQLQAQVEMMKLMRNNNNIQHMMNMMMVPAALPPQQLRMSLLSRMGVNNIGLARMPDRANANTNNAFITPPPPPLLPHFLMPQMIPAAANFTVGQLNMNVNGPMASRPLHDPYSAFLAQRMSMDSYHNKLAALHQQQTHQSIHPDGAERQ